MTDHPQLTILRGDAAGVRTRVQELFSAMSEEQLTWKPSPNAWSIAECFDHLCVTGRQYHPRIADAIERVGGKGDATRAYRPRFLARLFVKFAGPDGSKRLKAPKAFQPGASSVSGAAMQQFDELQGELLELIERAGTCDLNGGRFGSPVTSLLRFSIGEALELLVRHQQRHVGQAERVTQAEGFPSASAE